MCTYVYGLWAPAFCSYVNQRAQQLEEDQGSTFLSCSLNQSWARQADSVEQIDPREPYRRPTLHPIPNALGPHFSLGCNASTCRPASLLESQVPKQEKGPTPHSPPQNLPWKSSTTPQLCSWWTLRWRHRWHLLPGCLHRLPKNQVSCCWTRRQDEGGAGESPWSDSPSQEVPAPKGALQ